MAEVDHIEEMINLLESPPPYDPGKFRSQLMKLKDVVVEGKLRLQENHVHELRSVVNALEDMLYDDMSLGSSKLKDTKSGNIQKKIDPAVIQVHTDPEAQPTKKHTSFLGVKLWGRSDPESTRSSVKSPTATSSTSMFTADKKVSQSSQSPAHDQFLRRPQSNATPGQIQSPDKAQPQQQFGTQAKRVVDPEIRKIVDKLTELKDNGEVQMLFALINSEVPTSSSTLAFHIRDLSTGTELRKVDKQKIVNLLDSSGKDFLKVIPIVGDAGIGKTTIARLVYHDETVRKQFDLRAWISVCQGFVDLKLVSRNGTKSFITAKLEELDMNQTKNVLKQDVEGKRFLLVLDDVWRQLEPKNWHTLRDLLKGAAPASRIMATTSFPEVVEAIRSIEKDGAVEKPYSLEPLTADNSMVLCKQVALDEGLKEGDTRIKNVAEEIVEKCEGVPLAIEAAARLLYSLDPQKQQLSLIHLQEITESIREKKIMEVLKFCYNNLPTPLKQCFAYCSLFPRGYTIGVETLIKLWTAHGIILHSDHQDAEKIGRQYFMELYRRSFLHDAQEDEFGIVKSCKMHDLMHELATQVAQDTMLLLDQQEKKKTENEESTQPVKNGVRHLAFNFIPDSSLEIPSNIDIPALLTFLMPRQMSRVVSANPDLSKTLEGIVARTKRLRVLDLHNSGLSIVPKSITSLKDLTFLDLSRNGMKKLGVSISSTSLPHLQTLKLSLCEQLEELPSDIGCLQSLKHLQIDGCRSLTSMPAGLMKLTSLMTLPLFVVSNRSSIGLSSNPAPVEALKSLTSLGGTLEIVNLERLVVGPARGILNSTEGILNRTEQLQRLSLRWDRDDDDAKDAKLDKERLDALEPHQNLQDLSIVGYGHDSFSAWLRPFKNLIRFSLYNCPKLTNLPSLDELSSLKVLELQSMNALTSVTEDSSSSSAVLLPSLVQLTLWDCANLENWTKSAEAPSVEFSVHLKKLDIRYCPSLISLPQYTQIQDELYLEYASPELLKMTMVSTLSKLKSLYLKNVEGINSLEQQWVGKLACLEYLHIRDCPELTSLSKGILALSSLRSLIVENCRELELSDNDDDGDYDGRKSRKLRVLTIERIPKLKSLPQWLKDVQTLQVVKLSSCSNLETLPEWIDSFCSLNRLAISGCPKLASLPRTLSKVDSLYTLIIDDCPLLLPRLQKETGEDWSQIANVPNLILKRSI